MHDLLKDCREIEVLASRIYRLLAENNGYAEEVRRVFRDLSDDERAHARNIDLVLQAAPGEVTALPKIAWTKVEEAKRVAEQLFLDVCAGGLDEKQALQVAVRMEREFIKVHVENVLHFQNPALVKLFKALQNEDQRHLDALEQCLKWWTGKETGEAGDGS